MLRNCLGLLLCAFLTAPVLHAETPLSGKTKTYCFGRYLVDIPVEMELGVSNEQLGLFSIKSMKGGDAEFNKMVQSTLDARTQKSKKKKDSKEEEDSRLDQYKFTKREYPTGSHKQLLISEDKDDSKYYLIDVFMKPKGEYFFYSIENEIEEYYFKETLHNPRFLL